MNIKNEILFITIFYILSSVGYFFVVPATNNINGNVNFPTTVGLFIILFRNLSAIYGSTLFTLWALKTSKDSEEPY